ncbi:hypothetical protein BST38_08525 [Mycolicibacterium parafortuitum]|nr:hypothetical protein BST38_08525 [Mycolicibacterium parafortuitum]
MAVRAPTFVVLSGLLAVALAIAAGVAASPATADAGDDSSNVSARAGSVTSAKPTGGRESRAPSASTTDRAVRDDPASMPAGARTGARRDSTARPSLTAEPDVGVLDEVDPAPETEPTPEVEPVPAAADQVATPYGQIGKWMQDSRGDIADYGGLPFEGRTVLETVNVVIVDTTSRSRLEATWRLNAAMRRAGFPPRLIHSTGFRGLIDNQLYRQQPQGLLVGYSDAFFLAPNNHGRIFGPDPVETAGGYVWSGAFSTEEFVFYQRLPRHAYVSSNQARDALAAKLIASGRATSGGTVSLANSYNTATVTTGDHDGYAVVLILNNLTALGAAAPNSRRCAGPEAPYPWCAAAAA